MAPEPREAARKRVRDQVPHLDDDRHLHPDIAAAVALVRSGVLAEGLALPGVA